MRPDFDDDPASQRPATESELRLSSAHHSSLEGAVLAAAIRDEFLHRAASDGLIEYRLLVAVLAEDAAEPLHVLRGAPRAGKHNAHVRRRHVHSFVQYLA